jgi:hypothetical protein
MQSSVSDCLLSSIVCELTAEVIQQQRGNKRLYFALGSLGGSNREMEKTARGAS